MTLHRLPVQTRPERQGRRDRFRRRDPLSPTTFVRRLRRARSQRAARTGVSHVPAVHRLHRRVSDTDRRRWGRPRGVPTDADDVGVYVPPMVWCVQQQFSRDASLLVFASRPDDPDDRIGDYHAFVAERSGIALRLSALNGLLGLTLRLRGPERDRAAPAALVPQGQRRLVAVSAILAPRRSSAVSSTASASSRSSSRSATTH